MVDLGIVEPVVNLFIAACKDDSAVRGAVMGELFQAGKGLAGNTAKVFNLLGSNSPRLCLEIAQGAG